MRKGDVVLDLLPYKEKSSRSFWALAVVEQALRERVAGNKDKLLMFACVIVFPPIK